MIVACDVTTRIPNPVLAWQAEVDNGPSPAFPLFLLGMNLVEDVPSCKTLKKSSPKEDVKLDKLKNKNIQKLEGHGDDFGDSLDDLDDSLVVRIADPGDGDNVAWWKKPTRVTILLTTAAMRSTSSWACSLIQG